MDNSRQQGKLKLFLDRGFGFIVPDDLSEDIFVHAKDLMRADIAEPPPAGARFEFRIEKTDKGRQARDLRLVVPSGSD